MRVWYPGPFVRSEHREEAQNAGGREIKPGWNEVPDSLGRDYVASGFCAAAAPAAAAPARALAVVEAGEPVSAEVFDAISDVVVVKDPGAEGKTGRR